MTKEKEDTTTTKYIKILYAPKIRQNRPQKRKESDEAKLKK